MKFDHIQSNSIVLEQIKTDDIVYVPLINMAKAIIKDQDESNKFVFKINSNQKYNEVLKDIVFFTNNLHLLINHIKFAIHYNAKNNTVDKKVKNFFL